MSEPLTGNDELTQNDKSVHVLVEIIGGYQLKTNWVLESAKRILAIDEEEEKLEKSVLHPYCEVSYKGEVVHQTDVIRNSHNPIWTVEKGSLFILSFSVEDLCDSSKGNQVHFAMRSKASSFFKVPVSATTRRSKPVGKFSISPMTILKKHCTEERFEFSFDSKSKLKFGKRKASPGLAALRFRVATKRDIKFVEELIQRKKTGKEIKPLFNNQLMPNEYNLQPLLVTEKEEKEVFLEDLKESITSNTLSFFERGIPKVIAKPHPDPKRVKKTRFMTRKEIEHETFSSPSHHWVKAGSGQEGKIFLEVLACDDLPNMDLNVGGVGDVTDAFVTILYEDVLVQTPVIQNELSPRWLPWTQRAFIFYLTNPSSSIYLSVFDYDLGFSGHKPIGRAVINFSNFKPGVVYNLNYNLYPSCNMSQRQVSFLWAFTNFTSF